MASSPYESGATPSAKETMLRPGAKGSEVYVSQKGLCRKMAFLPQMKEVEVGGRIGVGWRVRELLDDVH